MKRYAVIVAGGQGVRMGADRPKQFLEIGGKPILRHTIERFLAFDPSIEVVVALPTAQKEAWRDYCRREGFLERYTMVSGGITRFHSVQNALKYVGDAGVVAVHDGVRPLVRQALLERLFDAALSHTAVIPAVPVAESLRRMGGEDATVPVDRTGMLLVPGMVFTIEPMINMGTWKVFIDADDPYGWEVITEDEKPSAQWEHTLVMTEHGVEVLTY